MTPGIGGATLIRIVTRNQVLGRTPDQFIRLSPAVWKEEYDLRARPATALLQSLDQHQTVLDLEHRLDALGVRWVTMADASYPKRVETMDPDAPGILFQYGNFRLLERETFCVLSSRKASPSVLEEMERTTEEGVLAGKVLVSGHDTPEYQRSAVVPLRWGAPRILCLDRGLFPVLGPDLRDEPFRAARLWRFQFDPTVDLVISPFRPEAEFIGVNNQVRDRLIACLSDNLHFAQVRSGGNMQKLAHLAAKAHRTLTFGPNASTLQAELSA
jgi:DNA processing protein